MIKQLLAILDVQKAVSASSGTVQDTYDLIVHNRDVMRQATGAAVEVVDGDRLRYAASRDDRAEVANMSLPLSGSLSGRAILAGRPYICSDSETDSRVDIEACRRVGLRSMIVTPIPYRGENIGVLKFYSDRPNAFGDFDQLVSMLLVGIIAISLSRISEAQALEMQGHLVHSAQLKQEFVSMVSHELKTPLAAILGALPLADDAIKLGDYPAGERFIGIAYRNADRLKRLVDDLMDVHLMDEGTLSLEFVPVELLQLVERARSDLAPVLNAKQVTCRITSDTEPVLTRTDPDRFSQVILNVLANAIRFSPAGGVVTVQINAIDTCARIAIEDQGPGVPANFREEIFSRFSTAGKDQRGLRKEGTGLGLFICRRLMAELGGSITLDEDHQQGARFLITVPMLK